MKQPFGVILAGGQATRMGGGDKGMLPLGGQRLIDHVMDRISPQVDQLAINANGDPKRWVTLNLPVLADDVADFPGPLAGVLAGMDWAATAGADHIVTVAADTPFFPDDLVPRLLLASQDQGKPIALAATPTNGKIYRHPTFGLWPVSLRDDLRAALADGVRKVVQWSDCHGTALAEFPVHRFDPFFNINTPDDLAHAQDLL
ncbi:MAG: molybdenum cofactor guanylyltransferase MobA [Planktomarina sp.]